MRPPRAAIVALAAAASAFILAPHRPRACAAAVARRASDGDDDGAAAGDDADGERSLPRRLWDRVRRKGGDDEAGEVGDAAPPVLSEADTTSLYAELGKRASEVRGPGGNESARRLRDASRGLRIAAPPRGATWIFREACPCTSCRNPSEIRG